MSAIKILTLKKAGLAMNENNLWPLKFKTQLLRFSAQTLVTGQTLRRRSHFSVMLLSQPLFTGKTQRSGHLKTGLKIQEEGALEPSALSTEGRAERSAQSRQLSVLTDNSIPIPTPLYLTPSRTGSLRNQLCWESRFSPCSLSQNAYTELLSFCWCCNISE